MQSNLAKLDVFFHSKKVGTLALTSERKVAFAYDKSWIEDGGFSLNPFYLPLNFDIFEPKTNYFDGLFGVFSDALPDSWGRLLLDRYLKSKGIDPSSLSVLTKLSLSNSNSFGGLSFEPSQLEESKNSIGDWDQLNEKFQSIIENRKTDDIDTLFAMGGSSGGSRPKAYITLDQEAWMIKFPHSHDFKNIGLIEYDYMSTAKECGINIPEIRLLTSQKKKRYFAIKRFDREGNNRKYVVSATSLLEMDFSACLLDYKDLFKLVTILTKEDKTQLKQLYLLMCFNVFSKNQDDHGKNFSFIYDEKNRKWSLSPAYDLTYSPTIYGEQSTMVNGKGRDIKIEDLAKLGSNYFASKKECISLAEFVKSIVEKRLSKYWKNQ